MLLAKKSLNFMHRFKSAILEKLPNVPGSTKSRIYAGKSKKGDFLKKPSRELVFLFLFQGPMNPSRHGTLNQKRPFFGHLKTCTSSVPCLMHKLSVILTAIHITYIINRKNGVKNIQAADYNGAHTVYIQLFILY